MEFAHERSSPPPSPTLSQKSAPLEDDRLSDETPLLPASHELKRASSRWVTTEPIIFFASICLGIFVTLTPQYLKHRIAESQNFTLSQDEYGPNGTCSVNTSDPDYITEQGIQADTSFWQMIVTISSYFPAMFTAPFIGAWSDKVGRKYAIGTPLVGYLVLTTIYLFVAYFSLPLWVLVIAYFCQGIAGNYGLILAGCYAYVADVTTKDKRMMRIVVIQTLFVLGIGVSQIISGLLIQLIGYTACLWLALIGEILWFIYLTVPPFLIETIPPKHAHEVTHIIDKSRLDSVYNLFRIDTDRRRTKLILLLLIAFLTEIFGQASMNITIIYGLGPPFCWNSVIVGWYSAMLLFVSAAGMILGSKAFARCLSDTWIIQVGMFFGVANGLLNAFSAATLGLFLTAVFTAPRTVDQPMFHLMLSKLVNADEQGVMFACESSVLNLAAFVSPLVLNTIYSATVSSQPNIVFYAMALLRIFPICLIIALQLVNRHHPDTSSEQTVRKDDVTVMKKKEEEIDFEKE